MLVSMDLNLKVLHILLPPHTAQSQTGLHATNRLTLRVLGHGYCGALKECAVLGFVVN